MATRLAGQETLGNPSVGGWTGVVLGGLMFFLGGGIAAVGLGWIEVDPDSVHAPGWVLAMVGAIFGLAGLYVLPTGVREILAQRRREHELLRRPAEPWLADRDWDPRGSTFTGSGRFLRSAVGVGFVAVFLTPFHWWAFFSDDDTIMVKLIVGLFDLFLLFVVFETVRRFLAMLRYGRSEVLYDTFPFFVGEELSVQFRRPANAVFTRLTFALQCVEERLETSGSGKNRSAKQVPYALWQEEVVVDEADGAGMPLEDHPLRFDLPADRPGNRLGERPPTYWMLKVTGVAAGPDYEGRFLLPVYERARARDERKSGLSSED
jgi:hypothetical protein